MLEANINFDNIIKRLDSNSLDERSKALKELSECNSPDVVEHFIRLLRDNSPEIQMASAEALIKYKDRRSVPQLIETLKDNNKEVKKRVIYVLGEIKDRSCVSPLIELLGDPRGEIRRECVEALGKLGDETAVEPLIRLLNDENKYVRLKAIQVLGGLGDERALEPLLDRLEDNSVDVKIETLKTLSELEDSRALDNIIKLFSDPNPKVRIQAVKSARIIGDDRALDSYLKLLNDPSLDVRLNTINALEDISDERSLQNLAELMMDTNWRVRVNALKAIKNIGGFSIIDEISQRCIEDMNPDVRKTFLALLFDSGDERYIESVIPFIKDENWEVRLNTVLYFDNIGSQNVIEPLERFLGDQNLEVKVRAINALGKIASERCADSLLGVIDEDTESYIKLAVIEAIDKIGNTVYLEKIKYLLKDEDPVVREKTAQILKKNNLLNFEHFFEAASSYFREKKFKEVLDCLEKIKEFDSADQNIQFMKAVSLKETGEINKAASIFEDILTKSPDNTNFLREGLDNFIKGKNYDQALKAIDKLLKYDLDNDTVYYKKKAFISIERNQNLQAFDCFMNVYNRDKMDAQANIFLFNHYADKESKRALMFFENLFAQDFLDSEVYIKAVKLYKDNDNLEKSLEICKILEKKGISDQILNMIYVLFFLKSNMLNEASIYFDKIDFTKALEKERELVFEIMNGFNNNELYEKIENTYKNILPKLDINEIIDILNILYSGNSFSNWMELYRLAEKSNNDPRLCMYLMKKFLDRKDYTLFRQNVERFVKENGRNNDIIALEANMLFETGDYKKANSLLAEIYNVLNINQLEMYAESLRKSGNEQRALEEIEKLIKKTGNSKYEYSLIELYIELGKFEKATLMVRDLMEKYPEDYVPYYQIGKIYYGNGDFSEALTSFKRSLDLEKKNIDAMLGLAYIYIDKGIFEESFILLSEIKESFGKCRDYYKGLIYFYEKQNKWEKVLQTIEDFSTKYIADTYIEVRSIYAFFELGNSAKALNIIDNLEVKDLNSEYIFNISRYVIKNGNIELADRLIHFLLYVRKEENPEYVVAYSKINKDFALDNLLSYFSDKEFKKYEKEMNFSYIDALIENHELEEAGIRLDHTLEKYNSEEFNFLKGKLEYIKDNIDESVIYFEKSLNTQKPYKESNYYLSLIFRNKGDNRRALNHLLKLRKDNGFEIGEKYAPLLVEIYEDLNMIDEAVEVLEKNHLKENDITSKRKYASLLFKQGKYDESENKYKELLDDRKEFEIYKSIAMCQYHKKEYSKVITTLRDTFELGEDTECIKKMAISLERLERSEQAFSYFDRLKEEPLIGEDKEFVYYMALNRFRKEKYNDALMWISRLIKSGVRDFDVILLTARIYSEKNNYEKSISYYEFIEENMLENPDLVLEYSNVFVNAGKIDKGIFILEKGSFHESQQIYLTLANLYFSREMFDEALENIEIVLSKESSEEAQNLKGLIFEKQEMYENSLQAFEKANNFFKLGTLYTKLHKYEKALKYFNIILEKNKDDFEANCFKAIIFKETGEYEKAIEILSKLEVMYPERIDTYSLLGTVYEIIDDIENAVKYYEKMIDANSTDVEGYFKLATLYLRKEDLVNSKKYFNKVIQLDPENIGALSELAFINKRSENWRESEKLYKMLIEKVPDFIEAYIKLSEVYIESGKFSDSVLLLKNLADSENSYVNYLIGKSYLLMDDLENANNYTRRALSREKDFALAYVQLGDICEKMQRYEDAEFALKKAIDIDPLFTNSYINLSDILVKRGNYDEALQIMNNLTEKTNKEENDPAIIKAYSNIYKKKGDIDKSQEYLDKISSEDDQDYLFDYGENLYLKKEYDEALKIFQQYVKEDMKNLKVLHYMSEIYFKKKKYDSIINLLEFAGKDIKKDNIFLLDLGKAYFYKGDYDKAERSLKNAINLNPNNGNIYFYLGKTMSARKKFHESVGFYEKAVLMMPDDINAQFELAMAYKNIKRFNEAVSKLNQLMNVEELFYKVRKEKGFIYSTINMKDKALESFEEIYSRNMKDDDIIYEMSKLYKDTQPDKSLSLMKELHPDKIKDSEHLFEMIELFIKNNNLDEAKEKLEKFILDNPDEYRAYFYMGELFRIRELNGDAIFNYEKSINLNPACFKSYLYLSRLVGSDEAKKEYLEKYLYYDEDEDVTFEYAEVLYKLGHIDKAYSIIKDFSEYDIDENLKLMLMAKIYYSASEYNTAYDFIEKAININTTAENLKLKAQILTKLEKYEQALACYNEMEVFPVDHSELNKNKGFCHYRIGNIQEGIKFFKKALQMNSEDWEAYKGLAICYEKEGMYSEAKSIVENVLTYYPNNIQMLNKAAIITEKMGLLEEAIIYLKKVLKQDSEDVEANIHLASIYFKRSMYKESIEILGNLLDQRLSREFEIKARLLLADVFIELENYQAARKELERLIEYAPEESIILEKLALCYEKSSKFDEALRIYNEITSKDKTDWNVYLKTGDIYSRKGYLDKALVYYREALKYAQDESIIYYKIAQVYEDKQIIDKAISFYKESIKVNSEFEQAYHNLAHIYKRQGMIDESIELFEKLIRIKPDSTEALYGISRIYSRKKDYEKALEYLESLVKIEQENALYRLELAKTYHVLGKTDEAISESIKVVNIAQIDSPEAREAQEMLKPENTYSGF